MCDSIANGGYIPPVEKCCPPANVIIASNILDTNGNIICGNIISQDGTFTGNLYVSGNIISNIVYTNLNIAGILNTSSIVSGSYYGNASGLSNLNGSNLFGTISSSNLPTTAVVPGTYGSSANVFQGTIDQYGRVTQAANISILSSQWTTIDGNVAYQNGVSIGTLSNPPPGSNLYVLGTANISTLNVGYLTVNSAIVYGATTLNVYGISNLNSVVANTVTANFLSGDGSGLSNISGSNIAGTVGTAVAVTGSAQPNITSVGTLTGLNVQGLLIASDGSGISRLNASNITGTVGTAVAVTGSAQPNITSVGTLTGLNVQGLLIASNGSGISNLNASNIIGTVGTAVAVTGSAQPNITSVGTLKGLSVQGLLSASNGSGIANLSASSVVGTVSTAKTVTEAAQPFITSVGTLTSLDVSGLITGSGEALIRLPAANIVGTVATATLASAVTGSSQSNITSLGTLSNLRVGGDVDITGTVSGQIFIGSTFRGDGSGLSKIQASNIQGSVASAVTATVVTQASQPNITSVGSLTSLTVAGTLSAGTLVGDGFGIYGVRASTLVGSVPLTVAVSGSAQPNITSVGTLTSLRVSGLIVGSGQALSSLQAANIVGAVATSTLAVAVTGNAQPNITSVGTLSALSVSGALTAGFLSGNASGLSNIQGPNVTGVVGLAGAVVQPDQPNITSVGLLSNLAVSNSVTSTNVFANFANVSGTGIFGGVGIGTSTPFGQFEISSPLPNQRVSMYLSDGATGLGDGAAIIKESTQDLFIENYQNADIILASSGTNRMRMYAGDGQSIVGPLGVGPILSKPSLIGGATLQVSGNIYASNALTAPKLIVPVANIATLNVSTAANITNLNVSRQTTTTNLLVQGALTSNASNTTFFFDTLTIPFINTAILGSNVINVFFLNVYSISNLNTITSTTANVGTLNVISISNLNSLTTNLTATTANVGTLNVLSISNLNSLTTNLTATTANVGTLNVTSVSNLQNLYLSNSLITTNISFQNAILNTNLPVFNGAQGTWGSSANVSQVTVDQYGRVSLASNIAILSSQWSTVNGNVAYQNGVSIGTLAEPPSGSNLYVPGTASIGSLNVLTISNLNSLTTNLFATTANVGTLNVLSISNLNSLTTNLTATTANVGTLNVLSISNLNSLTTNLFATTANVGTLNVFSVLTATTANVGTLNVLSISNLNSLTTNLTATTANVGTLNVSTLETVTQLNAGNVTVSNSVTVSNLVVSSNILPGSAGNTYVVGNVVVTGNIFSALGSPLGSGGGYYFSLPTDIALQPSYTGPVGTARPLSVGLSNGFTINGTSTFITVTTNGNFKFSQAGPYKLSAVFSGSDNLLGLAVGSNVADIHGTDQNYLYRYTTFVSQNPTELIEIPINVTNSSLYYYLDLFAVDGGQLRATGNTSGGTYLTITPLTGGGLATGGPGGTPGTQWISSDSNIYFPNSVGIGAVNPAYNLDVSTGTTATQILITSNISSLGVYGPALNINSNVTITANLAIGGLTSLAPLAPPYALTVYGQGYFSNHVSYQNFAGYRNRLVNGTFRVAARANTITVSNTSSFSTSNTWFMDRWRVDVGGLSTSNVSMIVKQDAPVGTTNGFTECANVYVTRALTGTTGNTWVCPISQTIETSFIFDFKLGQPSAKPSVFSFYANTLISGDYSVVFRSRQDNTYFANLVSITAGNWSMYTIYLPACYIGSWAQSSTAGYMDVLIGGVSYGTNSSNNRAVAVTSSWTANPGFAPVSCIGATKWPASTGLVLQVTAPQLEEGTIATPFEIRPLTQTLIYCQRFYETNTNIQYAAALGSGRVNSIPFVTTKRNNANVSVYTTLSNLSANTNISQFTAYYGDGTLKGTQAINSYTSSPYGFTFNFTNTGSKFMDASIMEAQFVWQADAEIY